MRRNRLVLALTLALGAVPAAAAAKTGEARLLRFPDIHRDFVVFVHGGDIWRAPVSGGEARRLTAHTGLELFPQISHDGRWIAYTAEYSGSRQVHVMPASGGPGRQLTFYTDVGAMPPRGGYDNWILGWTADGKILVRMNRTPWGERMGRYFLVDPAGGLEVPLELPEGGSASLSPDGRRIAYCPVSREFRTWKRTRGGRAQDIWIYDFDAKRSTRVTDSPATENFPLWSARALYYTSDAEHTLNLYARDLDSDRQRRVTDFDEFDVLWPSLGPESIVFMNGGYLYRLGLDDETVRRIPIRIRSEMPSAVPHFESLADSVASASPSPTGSRAVLEARGELFSVPAVDGATRNLTRTPGVRELSPAWSPDGRSIAYLSDASGEYEIYVRPQDPAGRSRRLTHDGSVWRYPPLWSPDSERIAFADRDRRLMIVDVADGSQVEVDRGERRDLAHYRWSPDGRHLAYERTHPSRLVGVAVYSLDSGESTLLGDGMTQDYEPVFSSDGEYLFFLSDRDFNLTFSSFEFNYVYTNATRVYAAALRPDAKPLFPPKSDEETGPDGGDADDKAAPGKDKKARKRERKAPLVARGWTARTVALPGVGPGNYASPQAAHGALFYMKWEGDEPPGLYRYDLDSREEKRVLRKVDGYELSADGKRLLYFAGKTLAIVAAEPGQDDDDGHLDLSTLRVKVDPRREWSQAYEDAWRITRDWFYDPDMHGKDWKALGQRYRALVRHVAHRSDLDFVLGELIGELEAGHTYVQAGDEPAIERVAGGMLGCELVAEPSGRYRIAKIYPGENWDPAFRSPLTDPGVDVREGDYLLAIDGEPLPTSDNPYRLLEGKAERPVALRVADDPSGAGARDVTVAPVSSELNLRYLDWVRSRMELTRRLSDDRVGYIHLPNTGGDGNRMLQKLFYSQIAKPALIIDDRYNGGGYIPDRMIEYLTRRTLAYWAQRDVESMRTPGFAHDGPKAMLINRYSSSGGDALPYFFREAGLGPLIGTRTWGGLIGLTGNPPLIDGGAVLIPTFRIYDTAGRWVVENEGVEPDHEVVDLPEARIAGGDPSLEKAVTLLLEQLDRTAGGPPPVPRPPRMPDPDR